MISLCRFGRKRLLIMIVAIAGTVKIFESFAWTFELLLLAKFIDAAAASSIFPCSYVLIMENVEKNHRILMTSITLIYNASASVVLGSIAMATKNFELTIRIIGGLGMLSAFFGFFFNESLRWLIVNRRKDKAIQSVEKTASANNIQVSAETYRIIAQKCDKQISNDERNADLRAESIKNIFLSAKLFIRIIVCAICWIIVILLSYGISIFSVSLPGDKYTNFIVVGLGNIPGILLYYFMLTYMKRRPALCISFMATGLLIICSKYVQNDLASLMLFFCAKSFSQHLAGAIYIYTTEMWPTTCRHSILGLCSMFGRIGLILAPLMPLTVSD